MTKLARIVVTKCEQCPFFVVLHVEKRGGVQKKEIACGAKVKLLTIIGHQPVKMSSYHSLDNEGGQIPSWCPLEDGN